MRSSTPDRSVIFEVEIIATKEKPEKVLQADAGEAHRHRRRDAGDAVEKRRARV